MVESCSINVHHLFSDLKIHDEVMLNVEQIELSHTNTRYHRELMN